MRRKLAVLISGRGSNMVALAKAAEAENYPVEICLVLSNVAGAPGIDLARQMGMHVETVPHASYLDDRAGHETAIDGVLQAHGIEFVCLAGYLRLLTPLLVERWRGRMLNIHPSLLPAFAGLNTHARALKAGVKLHGCTVHLVTDAMDEGQILAQAAVPVLPGDTEQALAARVLAQEHLLYPETLGRFVEQRQGHADPASCLRNPLPEWAVPP